MRSMKSTRGSNGFTLIELLIVIVIVGILAAVAVPRFASAKGKAFDGTAKSDLRNAVAAQEAYYADNQVYADDLADLTDFNPSQNVTVTIEAAGVGGFVMTSEHSPGQCWEMDSDDGVITLRGDDC
jgi:prepilin-type N-terminal cleavage/methylation domain-containing protein